MRALTPPPPAQPTSVPAAQAAAAARDPFYFPPTVAVAAPRIATQAAAAAATIGRREDETTVVGFGPCENCGLAAANPNHAAACQIREAALIESHENHRNEIRNAVCRICHSRFWQAPLNELMYLQCGHLFHRRCVNRWQNGDDRCPLCRKEIREFRVRYGG